MKHFENGALAGRRPYPREFRSHVLRVFDLAVPDHVAGAFAVDESVGRV